MTRYHTNSTPWTTVSNTRMSCRSGGGFPRPSVTTEKIKTQNWTTRLMTNVTS